MGASLPFYKPINIYDMANNKVNEDDLLFEDGGDGVEYELYKHIKTGQLYKVPIEIVRDFDNAEDVASEHEAKFGKE